MARASLEYSFLPGSGLWDNGTIGTRAAICPAGSPPGKPCADFLAKNPKAKAQWRLEQEFQGFEGSIASLPF